MSLSPPFSLYLPNFCLNTDSLLGLAVINSGTHQDILCNPEITGGLHEKCNQNEGERDFIFLEGESQRKATVVSMCILS